MLSSTATSTAETSGINAGTNLHSSGRGGNITFVSRTLELNNSLISSSTNGADASGDLTVKTGALKESDGGDISSSTAGPGAAAKLSVTVTGAADLAGVGGLGASGIFAESTKYSDGPEGHKAYPGKLGNAGPLTFSAGSLRVSDGAQIAGLTYRGGAGGNVDVTVNGSTVLDGRGTDKFTGISAQSLLDAPGAGDAGSITVRSGGELEIMGNAQIVTSAKDAGGGNLEVIAPLLQLSPGSEISTASRGEKKTDNGGNISIGRTLLLFLPGIQTKAISADARKGGGGNIFVSRGGDVLASPQSMAADEFSATGSKEGTIKIESPDVDLSGVLAPLVSSLVNNELSLAPACMTQVESDQSSFTVEGENGLPPDPGAAGPGEAGPLGR
jgi:hypothetical protein